MKTFIFPMILVEDMILELTDVEAAEFELMLADEFPTVEYYLDS